MKKNKKKGNNPSTMRCPYCGAPMILRSADGIYKENTQQAKLYVCKNYPSCNTYVRTQPAPSGLWARQQMRDFVHCEFRPTAVLMRCIKVDT